jgi:hypothetical protein
LSLTAETVAARWRQETVARRRRALAWFALFAAATLVAAKVGEVDLARLMEGLPRAGDYIHRTIPVLASTSGRRCCSTPC